VLALITTEAFAAEGIMADYVEGDDQLQDTFEEGNGDAAHDEVSVHVHWTCTSGSLHIPCKLTT